MAQPAERNLLFGVLALQRGFLNRDQLVAALTAWAAEPTQSLASILIKRGMLGEGECAFLEMAVQEQVEQHGNASSSIASLGAEPVLRDLFDSLHDSALSSSLAPLVEGSTAPKSPGDRLDGPATTGSRYRIVRRHAAGGLGEVFLAHDEELDREVALKKIQEQYADDRDLCARFLLEAEVTGGLEHPGIVPVYSLGKGDDGRPFYAMRFIRGESLKEAIQRFHLQDAARNDPGVWALGLRKRLSSFVAVCNAVAYAHSRGVLHRDLKPENIMLGPYGETLLVDWGLAKIVGRDDAVELKESSSDTQDQPSATLRPAAAGGSTPTQLGSAVGTLAYMSPEQAAGLVDQLGPASDIYGLGSTLYTLLTGRVPFPEGNVEEIRQEVILGKVAAPRKVNPRVPVALEAVCLKAMALDPARRYASAQDVADEIEAWLADEPVRAWPEPLALRAGRWLRRHRTVVSGSLAAILVALVSLALGVVLLTAANQRERRAKELADQRGEEARQNFQMARAAVDKYLTRVSQDARLKAHGLEPLRRELLETARDFYGQFTRQKPDEPELRWDWAWAHFRLADIVAQTGSKQQAIEMLRKSLGAFAELARQSPDNDKYQSSLAKCRVNLGLLYCETGRTAEAWKELKEALALNQGLAARRPGDAALQLDLANVHQNMARLHVDAKQPDQAERCYLAALAIRRALAEMQPETAQFQRALADTQCNVGLLYQQCHRRTEAAESLKAARTIQQRLVREQPNVPDCQCDLAATCDNLGILFSDRPDEFPEAERAHKEALLVRERLAREHAYVTQYQCDLARSHNNLATLYCKQGRFGEAEGEYKKAQEIHQRLADAYPEIPEHQNLLAATLNNLAYLYGDTERTDEALAAYRKAVEIRKQLVQKQPAHPDYQDALATTYGNLGTWLTLTGRLAEAEPAYRDALQLRESLAKQYPQAADYTLELATVYTHLGHLLRDLDQAEASLAFCRKAVDLLKASPSLAPRAAEKNVGLKNACWGCAEALGRMGKHAEALDQWDQAVELSPADRRDLMRLGRAESLVRAGQYARAVAEVQELLPSAEGVAPVLYRLAAIDALAAAVAKKDASLAVGERDRLAEQHGAAAVKILGEAKAAGLFGDPSQVKRLDDDRDLESLRPRDDFGKLRKGL
jgi:serine/threonine-protein kinase